MAMSRQAKEIYEFGPFRIDASERLLIREGQNIPLAPKAFDTLMALVESRGHLIEKEELMQRVWPDTFVEETNLSNNISLLRKALGDDSREHRYIETVPRRGYRFIAAVAGLPDTPPAFIVQERIKSRLTLEQKDASELDPTLKRAARAKRILEDSPGRTSRTAALVLLCLLASGLTFFSYRLWSQQKSALIDSTAELQSPSIKSIAVLPFRPLVENARDESLEIGMSETLITRLSGIKGVVVRPVSAVRKYNSLEQDPIRAGQQQKVDAVIDGNLQRTAERVRVTVRLLRVKDGYTLWADKFDEPLADIFALQDSISERVVAAMSVKLTGEQRELLTRRHTNNPEAYHLYLKGRLFYKQWTEESIGRALECFDGAIALDPNYALAYAAKAEVYSANSSVYMAPGEAIPRAREAAHKALEIDEELAEAHRSMAHVKQFGDWDLAGAEREYRRALELKPNEAELHVNYCGLLVSQKRFDEALVESKRALELDPFSFTTNYRAAWGHYMARQYEQALEQYREVIALYPNYAEGHGGLGCVLRQKEMYEQALKELQKSVELHRTDRSLSELGYTYALAGRPNKARELVKELELLTKRRYVSPVNIARIYAGLGQQELVFRWLQKAYDDRSDHLLALGVDPSFDGSRSHPRFADLLRQLGLEHG